MGMKLGPCNESFFSGLPGNAETNMWTERSKPWMANTNIIDPEEFEKSIKMDQENCIGR